MLILVNRASRWLTLAQSSRGRWPGACGAHINPFRSVEPDSRLLGQAAPWASLTTHWGISSRNQEIKGSRLVTIYCPHGKCYITTFQFLTRRWKLQNSGEWSPMKNPNWMMPKKRSKRTPRDSILSSSKQSGSRIGLRSSSRKQTTTNGPLMRKSCR